MNNINNINFKGRFQIDQTELGKVPFMKKIEFLSRKDQLIADFCPSGDSFSKSENGYIINIKDEKEPEFLDYLKYFKIKAKKIKE